MNCKKHIRYVIFSLCLCLYTNLTADDTEKRIYQGMSAQEAIEIIGGTELEPSHKIWRTPLILNMFTFIESANLRIFQCETPDRTWYEFLELDDKQTVKNVYKVKPFTNYSYVADVMGTFAEVFNSINKGDDYNDVVKKIGQGHGYVFYCDEGVWYFRVNYEVGRLWCPVKFFGATGKVADIDKINLEYFRSSKSDLVRELEDGRIEVFSH